MTVRPALALCAALAACASPPLAADAAEPFASFFPPGQCTSWAYTQRPDIVNIGVTRYHFSAWDAWQWPRHARAEGYRVNHHPQPGDIAVWPRNTAGAGPFGHVAFVDKVAANGKITISEMDWNGVHAVRSRKLAPRRYRRLLFIHRRL